MGVVGDEVAFGVQCDPEVVGVAAAGGGDVELFVVGLRGDHRVRGIHGHALGPVRGGGIAQVGVRGEVVGGQGDGGGVAVPGDVGVTVGVDACDGPQFLSSVSNRPEQPLSEDYFYSRLKSHREVKDGNLAFNVVFQRSLVNGYLEYQKVADAAIEELSWIEEDEAELPDLDLAEDLDDLEYEDMLEEEDEEYDDETEIEGMDLQHPPSSSLGRQALRRVEEYVEVLNEFVDTYPDVLSISATFDRGEDARSAYFWAGTLRTPEGQIDFTQGASNRAKELLFMIAVMCLYSKQQTEDQGSSFDDFWGWIFESDRPSIIQRFSRSVYRFANGERSAAGRILTSRDEEFDRDSARDEVYWRLSHVWEVMEL